MRYILYFRYFKLYKHLFCLTSEKEITCWQCSDYNYILDRLNVGHELNELTHEQLNEILLYAVKSKYGSTHSYNGNLSYRANDKELADECRLCREKRVQYITKTSPSKTINEYVNIETFEALAEKVNNLKSMIIGRDMENDEITTKIKITNLMEENEKLSQRLMAWNILQL